jgi:hypothetical protein
MSAKSTTPVQPTGKLGMALALLGELTAGGNDYPYNVHR